MAESQMYTVSFLAKKEEAKDIFTFSFRRPDIFEFIAGQYNRWILPGTDSNGKTLSHFFTISSSPSDPNIMLTTKLSGSEYKNKLLSLEQGEEIKIFGPMGDFTLESDPRPSVFLAGGIGITPFHSILRYLSKETINRNITLLASFSTPEEIIFKDELEKIASEHPEIKIIFTVTRLEQSRIEWQGERGRISPELIEKYVTDLSTGTFYIAGPGAMVNGTKQILETLQIKEDQVHTEEFPGY